MNVVDSSAWLEYFADSIILSTARAHGATLWTQDADFQGKQGVEYRPREAT